MVEVRIEQIERRIMKIMIGDKVEITDSYGGLNVVGFLGTVKGIEPNGLVGVQFDRKIAKLINQDPSKYEEQPDGFDGLHDLWGDIQNHTGWFFHRDCLRFRGRVERSIVDVFHTELNELKEMLEEIKTERR